jgi:hypothetical protein
VSALVLLERIQSRSCSVGPSEHATTWECALAGEDVSQSIYTDCAGAFLVLAERLYTGQSMGIRIASAGMAAENAWNFPDNHVYTTQDVLNERQSGFHCTAPGALRKKSQVR